MSPLAWLCAWALLLSRSAVAEDSPLARDSWAKTNSAPVACAEGSDVDRLFDLIQDHDEEAATRFFMEHDDCRRLLPETLGKIEDLSVFHWRYCFRPRGEPDCVWVKASSVMPASAPDLRPDQCELTARAIAKATDATWVGKSEVGGYITLAHADVDDIEVYCVDAHGKNTGTANAVSVSSVGWSKGKNPSAVSQAITANAFRLLAAAGTVAFGSPFQATASEAQRCFQTAARADGYQAESKVGTLVLSCLAGPDRTSGAIVLSAPGGPEAGSRRSRRTIQYLLTYENQLVESISSHIKTTAVVSTTSSYMLDTNVFNDILSEKIPSEVFAGNTSAR